MLYSCCWSALLAVRIVYVYTYVYVHMCMHMCIYGYNIFLSCLFHAFGTFIVQFTIMYLLY